MSNEPKELKVLTRALADVVGDGARITRLEFEFDPAHVGRFAESRDEPEEPKWEGNIYRYSFGFERLPDNAQQLGVDPGELSEGPGEVV